MDQVSVEPVGVSGDNKRQLSPLEQPRRRASDARDIDGWLRSLRDALRDAGQGDFGVRLPTDRAPDVLSGEASLAFNAFVEQAEAFARETHRVSLAIGNEGQLAARMALGPVNGLWARSVEAVNVLI